MNVLPSPLLDARASQQRSFVESEEPKCFANVLFFQRERKIDGVERKQSKVFTVHSLVRQLVGDFFHPGFRPGFDGRNTTWVFGGVVVGHLQPPKGFLDRTLNHPTDRMDG